MYFEEIFGRNCLWHIWRDLKKNLDDIIKMLLNTKSVCSTSIMLNPIKLHSHKQKPNFQFFCRIHLLDQMRFLIAFKSFSKASPGHWISMTLVYGRKWWKWMIEEMHHHLIDCTEIGNHWKHIVLKFQSAFFKNSSLCYLIRNSEPVLFNVGLNGLQKQQFFVQW